MTTEQKHKYETHTVTEDTCPEPFIPTGKWVVGILCFIVFAATGIIVADTRNGIETAQLKIELLQKEKVDKEQYRQDVREIKSGINELRAYLIGRR